VAAKTLQIPMDKIKVQPTSAAYNINSSDTGGSITSDMNCVVSVQLSHKFKPSKQHFLFAFRF
jgi:xanthine dehydrogenase molybdopterin-binding subunit B